MGRPRRRLQLTLVDRSSTSILSPTRLSDDLGLISETDLQLLAQVSPASLMLATEPKWGLPAHIRLIDDLLVQVAAGELKRLIVSVPVRHGKSEMCSRFYPAWRLGMFPNKRIVVAGYGAEFAEEWGAKARDLLIKYGPRFYGVSVNRGSSARARWTLEQMKGGMFALGVGGMLTGRGADDLIIDDPHKNSEEADSELLREKIWQWFWGTARTRLEPHGAIVILMARWHEDDLTGRLLNHPVDVEPWTHVVLPALAEDNDPIGRQPGEALWPERYGRDELEAIRRAQLPRYWSALYQQRPSPAEGFMFKRADFRYWRVESVQLGAVVQSDYVFEDGRRFDTGVCPTFQVCDVAISSKQTADWTVVSTWRAAGDVLLLIDLERQRFEDQQVAEFMMRCSDRYGRPPMWVEKFGAGRSPLAILARAGYPVMDIPAEAGTKLDKVTRAFGAISLYQQHKVYHPRQADWLGAFEDELCVFDKGRNDDQVDCVSYAARLLPLMAGGQAFEPRTLSRQEKPVTAGIMGERF